MFLLLFYIFVLCFLGLFNYNARIENRYSFASPMGTISVPQ